MLRWTFAERECPGPGSIAEARPSTTARDARLRKGFGQWRPISLKHAVFRR
jgi:hypothetical protein